jgi:CubicO group peptidase (beta-lactamase class C family)
MSETTPEQAATLNLYSGEPQHEVFPRLKDLLRTTAMKPAAKAFQFPEGEPIALPARYEFEGVSKSADDFIRTTDTSALLVLKGGEVRFEEYWLTGGRDVHWISWSVAKSFISTLVGIAIEEGLIDSIDTPITHYVDALKGSAYDGASIKHVLQMSSGARWNEDYSDPTSDVHRLGTVMAGDASLAAFVAGIVRETEPGTVCQYNSADTQALGMLLVEATGRTVASYMQEKISEPLGMESPGYWLVDTTGMEMVLGGLILTARDFARIGELYRNKGRWNGVQIVSEDWVEASVRPDSAHLQAGQVIVGGHILPLGYGYQWWVPEGTCGEFSAIGVYNQFVYVDPSRDVVIVKLSANRTYGTTTNESENQEMETVEFLRAIARAID